MDAGLSWLPAALTVAVLAGAVLVAVSRRAHRRRQELEDSLAASREELAAVQRRLDGLARRVASAPRPEPQEFVITTAGLPEQAAPEATAPALPDRQLTAKEFASVALGESLVTIASFGYGVRRALSAENRNRIAFEVRREVRRARKQRKQDLKEAKRRLRAQALVTDDTAEDAA